MKINFNVNYIGVAWKDHKDGTFEHMAINENEYSHAVVDSNGLVPFAYRFSSFSPLFYGRADKYKNIIFLAHDIKPYDELYVCEIYGNFFCVDKFGLRYNLGDSIKTLNFSIELEHFTALHENIFSEYIFRKLCI